jgi:hypothetical protein
MSREKPSSKRRRLKEALGIAGVSLSLTTGASATTMPAPYAASHLLHDEEVYDVTLATFRYFDEKSPSFAEENAFRIAGSKGAGTGAGAGTRAVPATQGRCRHTCNSSCVAACKHCISCTHP